ncbi:MAG TPA: aldehyde dehydrogenase family protein, partial [Candidatus Hodarchaeales archaeon]|nr:aldehyde dehydrogenase family protein [Candidatus Hodarchaeales archaeon]
RIAWGKFFNAGQTCVAPDYLLVHKDVKTELLAGITMNVRSFYGQDPQKSPDYGRIVNGKHFKRLQAMLEDQSPENIFLGGHQDEKDRYFSPTIINNATLDCKAMGEEIFGPILPVLEFTTVEDVVRIVSRNPEPLALQIFSNDKVFREAVFNSIKSGSGLINDTLSYFALSDFPIGGVGASGFGTYHGRYSFEVFTRPWGVLSKSMIFDNPVGYAPYKKKMRILRLFQR